VVAMFSPMLTGERHAQRAVEAASALLVASGHADAGGPWIPLGAGVNTGIVWFGAVGDGSHVELTALGDIVNTTARLASVARAGEVLVTTEAAEAADLDSRLPPRNVELRGKQQATQVVSVMVAHERDAITGRRGDRVARDRSERHPDDV
jgi:adenylate cyclase